MNGLLLILVLLGCFVAGLEASAPGVINATTEALGAAEWCHEHSCKDALETAVRAR